MYLFLLIKEKDQKIAPVLQASFVHILLGFMGGGDMQCCRKGNVFFCVWKGVAYFHSLVGNDF